MRREFVVSLRARPRRIEWDGWLVAPFRETVEVVQLCGVAEGGEESCEKFGAAGLEFGTKRFNEVCDVPRNGHAICHGKFRAGEESFDLAEERSVWLRFEQGDDVAEECDALRGVGVGWSVQTPVRGENLAGFLQLAEHDEGERQIVAAMDGKRMGVAEYLCRCRCHSPDNRFSLPGVPLMARSSAP